MSYRFVRMLGSGLAEVTTPQGRTIRVSVPSGSNFRVGQIVQPTFNRCCQPTGLVLPTPSSGKVFKDVLQPRRVDQAPSPSTPPLIYVKISENVYPFLEISAGLDGSKTLADIKGVQAYTNLLPNKLLYLPKITAMPGETALVIGTDWDATDNYIYIANSEQGLTGYTYYNNELQATVLDTKPNPEFPDFDPDLDFSKLEPTVKDIFRVTVAVSDKSFTENEYLEVFTITPIDDNESIYRATLDTKQNQKTTPIVGIDAYPFMVKQQLAFASSPNMVRVHCKRTGGSISGYGTLESHSVILETTADGFESPQIVDTVNITYPLFNFDSSKIPNLVSKLYKSNPEEWVTFEVYRDRVMWDGLDISDPKIWVKEDFYERIREDDGDEFTYDLVQTTTKRLLATDSLKTLDRLLNAI